MILQPRHCVAFTGHRLYRDEARALLPPTLERLYARGFRTFLDGMAVGFDLAAARAVLEMRERHADVQLIAVVPFRGQEHRFPTTWRRLYGEVLDRADAVEILAEAYHRGCYAVRNDFLVDHAQVVVAWYDGSAGGTRHTVERARVRHREIINLHPRAVTLPEHDAMLF